MEYKDFKDLARLKEEDWDSLYTLPRDEHYRLSGDCLPYRVMLFDRFDEVGELKAFVDKHWIKDIVQITHFGPHWWIMFFATAYFSDGKLQRFFVDESYLLSLFKTKTLFK